MFRLISYPPKRPEGYKPPAGVTFESALQELSDKVPRMGDHFDRAAPGMHTTDTIDYNIVLSGEIWCELDDGVEVSWRLGTASYKVERVTRGGIGVSRAYEKDRCI